MHMVTPSAGTSGAGPGGLNRTRLNLRYDNI